MRLLKIFLIVSISASIYSSSNAGIGFGSKKAENRAQQELRDRVDKMVVSAEPLIQIEDSFERTLDILKEAYFQADQSNYTVGIIQSANLLADCYTVLIDYSKATSKYYIAMRHAETIGDSASMAKSFRGLGLVKFNMKQWGGAISDFNSSRDFNVLQDEDKVASLIDCLLGLSYYHLGRFEIAEQSLLNARRAAFEVGDSMRLLEIDLNLANVLVERSNAPSVLNKFDSLYEGFKQRNEKIGMCHVLIGKSRSYLKSGDNTKALNQVHEALDMTRNSTLNFPMQELLEVAVDAEYLSGNYKTSADLMRQLQELRESTLSQSTSTKVAMLSADYEFEKKEEKLNDQISEKNKQRALLIVLAVAFFLISIVIFLSLRGVAKERRRSDELLYNILPVETAKELKANGVAVAKAHNKVTIVFADVQNFTKIAGHLEPTVLVKLLDYYFIKFDQIIQHYGLEKIKTIGDAYMFVSGLNDTGSNSAINAVLAGMDMLKVLNDSKVEVQEKYGAHFNFRIGMHTGKTVSGVVGKIKYAFDIWGDSVNIAARMEAHSEPGKINITEDTYNQVKHLFTCAARGHIEVKNKGSMEMYFVETKKPSQN